MISAKSARETVARDYLVTACTADMTNAAILTPDMAEPKMHISGRGGNCPGKAKLHPEILRKARIVVEFEPRTRIEGDMQQLPGDFPSAIAKSVTIELMAYREQ